MAGRGSVFSNPRVLSLARSFVPAADEVWRLQRGEDADCRFFQRAVNGGEPITDKGTRQGIWVFAPSGKLLAKVNSNRAEVVADMLERGLAAWEELPPEERRLAEDAELEPAFRWEHNYPEGGLVLERTARDLRGDFDSGFGADSKPSGRFNRDFAWFTAEEARAWLPAHPVVGAKQPVPTELVARLARFHLVDNARGQTLPYAPEEIREASMVVEVVAREGTTVELELSGETEMVAEGPWLLGENLWKPKQELARGIATTLTGRATFDLETGAFTSFEAIAFGRRWGRSPMNGRGRDASPSVVGFHLGLAPRSHRIAPTFLSLYDADWVRKPEGWADHSENRP